MTKTSIRMTSTQRLALILIAAAQFVIALDYSIVYVALPSIGAELSITEANLQWIITAYALFFAGFLLLGGKVADRIGARQMYAIGIVLFGVASVVAGIATDGWVVIVARGAQGISAAFLQPSILSLLSANFASGAVRARAYSIWGAVGASGLAAGVIFGGLLTTASWRWIFLINVPLALFCVLGSLRTTDARRNGSSRRKIPFLSSVLGTAAVLLLVLTLTWVADGYQSSLVIIFAAVAAVIALVAFMVGEHFSRAPLVDRALRSISNLRRGSLAAALYMSSVGTEFFLITLFLQDQRGQTPLAAAVAFLPLAVMVTFGNMYAGKLLVTRTPAQSLFLGFFIAMLGLGLLAFSLPVENYWLGLFPGFVLSGFGHGIIFTSMFVLGTSGIPADLEGAGSSLITSAQYVSGAVGVAILVLILGQVAGFHGYSWAFAFNAVVALGGALLALTARSPAASISVAAEEAR